MIHGSRRSIFIRIKSDKFVEEIREIIKEKDTHKKKDIEKASRRIVFSFYNMFAMFFINRITGAVGTEKLSETYKSILSEDSMVSMKLIDWSIKLDYFHTIPFQDMEKFKKEISGNYFVSDLLTLAVLKRIHLFHVNYRNKQKICSLLGIKMETQRLIEGKSSDKR